MKDIGSNALVVSVLAICVTGSVIMSYTISENKVKIEYRDTCMTEYEDSIYWKNLEYQDSLRQLLID